MRSEKLEKKLLLRRVKKYVACLKGVKNTDILENLSFNYDIQSQQMADFYKYDSKGIYIKTHDGNGERLQKTLTKYLQTI